MTNIKILAGSNRPGRFNIHVANWVHDIAQSLDTTATIELIDLQELNLPFLDEVHTPMSGKYENKHTIEWAQTIKETDGFIIVTPEYNHSYPAVLKNALDYLFAEWQFKPVSFVSYGGMAGGARAVEHLRGVAGELSMFDLRSQVMLPSYWEKMDESGAYQFTEDQAGQVTKLLEQTIFWAEHMKSARSVLQKP
jgi:NAD(P)H-dependent FMN reductase